METIMAKDGRAGSEPPASAGGLELETEDQILTESGFYWREKNGIKALLCRPLEGAGFANGFSTRLGGVSPFPSDDLNLSGFNDDLAENIYENRRRFLATFEGNFQLATVWQIHSDHVKVIRTREDVEESDEKFDAVVSDLSGILAGVKTADCVPALLGDSKTRAFAAIHAGWRGTVQSIVKKAISAMKNEFGTEARDLICAIGPAASGKNYEIGQEVIGLFTSTFADGDKYLTPSGPGHALIDLHKANRDQAIDSGVKAENIFIAPFCTMERTDLFFSYRKEKKTLGKTGRLLAVIGRSE
jgi:purine-nucleoside/S-methyl-5'-thioadenosine phosphorylase / adenosine deaminase